MQTKLILHDIDFYPGHNVRFWARDCVVSSMKRFATNAHPPSPFGRCVTDKGIIFP